MKKIKMRQIEGLPRKCKCGRMTTSEIGCGTCIKDPWQAEEDAFLSFRYKNDESNGGQP